MTRLTDTQQLIAEQQLQVAVALGLIGLVQELIDLPVQHIVVGIQATREEDAFLLRRAFVLQRVGLSAAFSYCPLANALS
jgi:hypothetical protein